MDGLVIRTVSGGARMVQGQVKHRDVPECGRVYDCAGESWPAAYVMAVVTERKTNDRRGKCGE